MKHLTLIALAVVLCATSFWVGYTCGRDSAQLDYEYQMDVQEGAQR